MKPDVVNLYNQLTAEWNKKPPNLDKCVDILNQLKVNLKAGEKAKLET